MERHRPPMPLVDIVIPAFNEEAAIGRVIETLFARLASLPYRFEVIVVDDGSRDRTAAVAAGYAARHPVRVVQLTRNFGKENALLAGLDRARGAATILTERGDARGRQPQRERSTLAYAAPSVPALR